MANNDAAQYVLRFNEVSGDLEYGSGNNWTAVILTNTAGITQLTGDVTAGPGTGSQVATVTSSVAATNNSIVKRDSSGGGTFTNVITPLITGNGAGTKLQIKPSADSVTAFSLTNLAGTGIIKVDSIDNFVGINTTGNPNRALQVIGDGSYTGELLTGTLRIDTTAHFDLTFNYAAVLSLTPTSGYFTYATDTHQLYLANGTSWNALVKVGDPSTMTGTGTVTPDASLSNTLSTTVTGALTINGPTNGVDAQKLTFRLLQDGTGHTVTFATGAGNFRFGTDITSFTASGANKTDYVGAIFNSTASRWDIVSVVQGF
jgi:hypothetical protein